MSDSPFADEGTFHSKAFARARTGLIDPFARQFRLVFGGIEQSLGMLVRRQPRAAFRLARIVGRLRHVLSRRWPSSSEICELFDYLEPRSAGRVTREIAALEAQKRVLVSFLLSAADLPPWESDPELERLDGPLILVTAHTSALFFLGSLFGRRSQDVMAMQTGGFAGRLPIAVVSTVGHSQERAAMTHRALKHLKTGGILLVAADVPSSQSIDVNLLGRRTSIARGPFVLSAMSGAPVRPLAAGWIRGRVAVTIGPPLPAGGNDSDNAVGFARWMDGYLRSHPDQISVALVRRLLGSDGSGSSGEEVPGEMKEHGAGERQ